MPRAGPMPRKGFAATQSFFRRVAHRRRKRSLARKNPGRNSPHRAQETRPRSFHFFCSEQDASAFRFRLVSPRAAAHVWGKGGAHPYRDLKNNTAYLAEKAKNESKIDSKTPLTGCRGSGSPATYLRRLTLLLTIRRGACPLRRISNTLPHLCRRQGPIGLQPNSDFPGLPFDEIENTYF
jgi:hypothetical protein